MSVSEVIVSIGVALSSIAGAVIPSKEPAPIVHAEVQVISPTPTNTPTPTPTATPTPTNTPTPTPLPPTATPLPHTGTDLERWFDQYSSEYGANKELMKKIAACESGYNATSLNVAHDYGGMYQFARGTWVSTRRAMGHDENPDLRFNPEEAIRTAAFKIANGGAGAWPSCSR